MTTRGVVFIATSVDGYIARPDGGLDWLPVPSGEPGGEDYGYGAFVAGIDALVMGRRSYEQVLRFGTWPYGERRVIVLSRSLPVRRDAEPGHVEITDETPPALFARLSREGVDRVYVDGGQVVTACLAERLVAEMTITRIPVLLGEGLPLFGTLPRDVRLRHLRTRAYPNGLVQTTYLTAPSRG